MQEDYFQGRQIQGKHENMGVQKFLNMWAAGLGLRGLGFRRLATCS